MKGGGQQRGRKELADQEEYRGNEYHAGTHITPFKNDRAGAPKGVENARAANCCANQLEEARGESFHGKNMPSSWND